VTEAKGAATFRAATDMYGRFVGRYAPSLAAALIEVVGLEPGFRVLDVGCGPGGLAKALAEIVGEENVAAVDPSPPFVSVCRARLPSADVRVSAAEELPFDDGSFDAAFAQLVVNFMTDAERGVGEMKRIVKAGGTVAACTWDYRDRMTMLRTFWDAAHEAAPEQAAGADESLVTRQVDKVESTRASMNKMRTLMLLHERQVLTPDQRVRLNKLHEQMFKDRSKSPDNRRP
jgi:ubiquinone/menaquinone biosynthesis C-methylase UbiE